MGLLKIDINKCKRDGFCVRECPTAIIRMPKEAYPEITPGGICLECGHCVAVCPYAALSHEKIPIDKCQPILDELQINAAQALQFLRSRRSIRHFLARPVEPEKIRSAIHGARYAPTGGNSQTVEWLVLTDGGKIKETAALTVDWLRQLVKDPQLVEARPYLSVAVASWDEGNDSVLRGAPALVIAMAPKEAMNGMVDLTIALSYLDLLAPAMGLGTCWAGLLQGALLASQDIKRFVGIPASHPHHYPLMLGYPDVRYLRLPERKTPEITFA